MEWWQHFFLNVDEKDASRLESWFTRDLELQFANWPPVSGRDAALAVLEGFFTSIAGLSHQITGVVSQDTRTVVESIVTYQRLDGIRVSVPAATLLQRDGDQIKSMRIYVDQSPLLDVFPRA